jgi:hypothetical protein
MEPLHPVQEDGWGRYSGYIGFGSIGGMPWIPVKI